MLNATHSRRILSRAYRCRPVAPGHQNAISVEPHFRPNGFLTYLLSTGYHRSVGPLWKKLPRKRSRYIYTPLQNFTQYHYIIMRPSSLGGGRIMRRTLSVRLSVRPSRYRCHRSRLFGPASVTSRHLANYNDTHVLFGTH